MSSCFFKCPFEDCKHFDQVECAEFSHFEKHLAKDHDRYDLLRLAFNKGIIEDPIRYHNHNFVIQQIAKISKVDRDFN